MATRCTVLLVFLLVVAVAPAFTQIINNDFEENPYPMWEWELRSMIGETIYDWGGSSNPGKSVELNQGVETTNPEAVGISCISQTFDCGSNPDASCVISVEYRARYWGNPRVSFAVEIDGGEVFRDDDISTEWESTGPIIVECGTHTIHFCHYAAPALVNPSDGDYSMLILDNAIAECIPVVGTENETWGAIKSICSE
jgi:hypothetical protein